MSYYRTERHKFTIRNEEEKNEIMSMINEKVLCNMRMKTVGLITTPTVYANEHLVRSCICKTDEGTTLILNVNGGFPSLNLTRQDGTTVGDVEFKIPSQFINRFVKEEQKLVVEEPKVPVEDVVVTEEQPVVEKPVEVQEESSTEEEIPVVEEVEGQEEQVVEEPQKTTRKGRRRSNN